MKIALGTAQFGLNYGISNKHGQVDKTQVADILNIAVGLGIDTLDCAGAYGNSEQVLGLLLEQYSSQKSFNIVSKIPELSPEQCSIYPFFDKTLKHLKQDKIATLLFHHADNLLHHPKKEQLFQQLQTLKVAKKINRIGVSVYNPEQLKAVALHYPIELAQVPMNVFDQRFISADIIELCQQKQIKLHVRSLFLQGLLLIEEDKLDPYFLPYKEKFLAFTRLAKYFGCSTLTLALSIVAQELPATLHRRNKEEHTVTPHNIIEKVVIGVCSSKQLSQVVNAYQQAQNLAIAAQELLSLADDNLKLINPSLWKISKQ